MKKPRGQSIESCVPARSGAMLPAFAERRVAEGPEDCRQLRVQGLQILHQQRDLEVLRAVVREQLNRLTWVEQLVQGVRRAFALPGRPSVLRAEI